MIIVQAYKYVENGSTLFFEDAQKILLDDNSYSLQQGVLVTVICEVEGDYSTMYEPANAQERIQYLELERDLFGDETAQDKINEINSLVEELS